MRVWCGCVQCPPHSTTDTPESPLAMRRRLGVRDIPWGETAHDPPGPAGVVRHQTPLSPNWRLMAGGDSGASVSGWLGRGGGGGATFHIRTIPPRYAPIPQPSPHDPPSDGYTRVLPGHEVPFGGYGCHVGVWCRWLTGVMPATPNLHSRVAEEQSWDLLARLIERSKWGLYEIRGPHDCRVSNSLQDLRLAALRLAGFHAWVAY